MARVDEWVEVSGSSVDVAVSAALQELGLSKRDEVEVEILQEPSKGILGTAWRSQDAVVKVTPKPREEPKRRRRSRKRRSGSQDKTDQGRSTTSGSGDRDASGDGSKKTRNDGNTGGESAASKNKKPQQRSSTSSSKSNRSSAGRDDQRSQRKQGSQRAASATQSPEHQEATIEEQATVAAAFIEGLLQAFGLEGTVETEIDDDILKINVTGDQTEALVGRKGAIMQSVHEITRTVVQRKTFGAPRMRLDINGYGERRREALRIYSARQAERVLADGGEVMLEPMNAADRKVVHDSIGEIEGVESYSEGVEPTRAVVIAPSAAAAE